MDFDIHTILYLANLLLYAPVPLLYLLVYKMARNDKSGLVRCGWYIVVLTGMLMPLMFLLSQGIWVVHDYHINMPDWVAGLWMAYDVTNGLHYSMHAFTSYGALRLINRLVRINDKLRVKNSRITDENTQLRKMLIAKGE